MSRRLALQLEAVQRADRRAEPKQYGPAAGLLRLPANRLIEQGPLHLVADLLIGHPSTSA